MKKSGVQVFQQSSRGENMMLEILMDTESDELVSVLSIVCWLNHVRLKAVYRCWGIYLRYNMLLTPEIKKSK